MKKSITFAVLAALLVSCSDDDKYETDNERLISPQIEMEIRTASGQSPLTVHKRVMPQ